MAARAGIVITGNEVLNGVISDRNGPWLSERLREIGVELAHIEIVGDRPEDMLAALRFFAGEGIDLIVTSGGLGPTADDLTAEVVARFAGREMFLDDALEGRIWAILEPLLHRWPGLDPEALRVSNRKQAHRPSRARPCWSRSARRPGWSFRPAQASGPTVVVLPGPPRELQPMWEDARGTEPSGRRSPARPSTDSASCASSAFPESESRRPCGSSRRRGVPIDRLEITTCLRRGEIEIATRWEPADEDVYRDFERPRARTARPRAVLRRRLDHRRAGRGPASRAAGAHRGCGGVVHRWPDGRAADRPRRVLGVRPGGASSGHADAAKPATSSGSPASLIERHGAVSPEAAAALADGAIARFGADVGIGITGNRRSRAGAPRTSPWAGCASASSERGGGAGGSRRGAAGCPGSREDIRDRSTTVTMHLLRRLLRGEDGGLEAGSRRRAARA